MTEQEQAAATAEANDPPEKQAKSEPREYVVLEEIDHPSTVQGKEHYVVHSRVVALSKEEAIRKAFATQASDKEEQTFVAVTARSFSPKKVSTKTTTQLVLS